MIKFIKGETTGLNYPESKSEIVFVGRSNAGKSSLINTLYGKVAYVGKKPGKTRMLNFFDVDGKYTVCDVPGYGFANRSQDELIEFGEMMENYFTTRNCLKLCIQIVDIRHKPSNDDIEMTEFLKQQNIPFIIVANKSDKVSGNERTKSLKIIAETLDENVDKILTASCLKKTNIELIKEKISLYI